ncbi:siderophore-interacting protein [Phytoactinopolyspora alkaliphila]|uniref:Siderophore-interacting protein n=1 Tax=Phytoactinopolyspora alkaliphila TaxID=1783498 RepID=A0A6N9YLN7_9ACTN|nr:siderophore-interacting protein [Phytoactinopolyspora alkaliphila]
MVDTRRASGREARQTAGLLRVVGAEPITPKMLRLTLVVEESHLAVDPACPNQVLRLSPPSAIPDGPTSGARPPSRTYTIRRYDQASASLDIDVVLHGEGPFVRWASSAQPGDTIAFTGPRPHAVPSFQGDALLMVSDETGLPAVAALLEAAPRGLRVYAFIEIDDDAERQTLASAADVDLRWLPRDGAPAGTTGALEGALRRLSWPEGRVEIWVAGEASEVRAVRRFAAAERGVARPDIHAYGYWRLGRSGSPD